MARSYLMTIKEKTDNLFCYVKILDLAIKLTAQHTPKQNSFSFSHLSKSFTSLTFTQTQVKRDLNKTIHFSKCALKN